MMELYKGADYLKHKYTVLVSEKQWYWYCIGTQNTPSASHLLTGVVKRWIA